MKLPLVFALAVSASLLVADPSRAQAPVETASADPRLGPLKELDAYFPWTPPASREVWEPRAEQVRMQLRVAVGLWPEPTRTPLNAVVHGRIERNDHIIEKVFFESMPGFFVTGNLYRPKGGSGPYPAVLCPHGHWAESRFRLLTDAEIKKEIETGGERFPEAGRSTFQSIGVHLARMGCVAFVYDMIGYCDSKQISYDVAHRFGKPRTEMDTRENWGLFSPQAEANVQSVMGLQTWNSIRALDFLTTLPDVDAKRLACTGASGGATQTMLLAALDPRVAISCPAVMVSTSMQGGCACENASLLRVGTGNVEIAALFAPKPQGMTAANDWTKEMETKGFPELKQHYTMMGAPENVALWAHVNFPHNYNIVTREHIYAWFNDHFRLGLAADRLKEREYPLLQKDDLTVWDAAHPAPPGGDDLERKLLRWWHDDAEQQLAKAGADFKRIARPAWRAMIGRTPRTLLSDVAPFPSASSDGWLSFQPRELGRFKVTEALIKNQPRSEEISVAMLRGKKKDGPVILWLSERGKDGLFGDDALPLPPVQRLLDAGATVIGIDLFRQAEPMAVNRVSKNPREAAAFTYGYNHPLFAQRVHDVLFALGARVPNLLEESDNSSAGLPTRIVALDGTAPIVAAALALVEPGAIEAAVLDTGGFRFGALTDWRAAGFLPGAAKYGDLPGLVKLSTAKRLTVFGEGEKASAENLAKALDALLP